MKIRQVVAPLVCLALSSIARAQSRDAAPEIPLKLTTTEYQLASCVGGIGPSPQFVVSRRSHSKGGSPIGLRVRRFQSSRSQRSGEFAVNATTGEHQTSPNRPIRLPRQSPLNPILRQ